MSAARLKILSVLDVMVYGGDENRVLQLATNIDRERYDFRVALLRPPDPEYDATYGSLLSQFEAAGIEVNILGVARGRALDDASVYRQVRRVRHLVENVRRLVREIRREGIDIVDGHQAPGYLCATMAATICGIPSVVSTYVDREAWTPRPVWWVLHQMTLAAASAIVTDSDAFAARLRGWMLRKRHPCLAVIPNGPPPPVPTRSDADVRGSLGLRPRSQTRVIGQVATLFPGKGQGCFMDAAPAVAEKHPDVTFLMVGFERADSFGFRQELLERAARYGLADRVVVTPYQGPIGDVWQTIDIQAHPSAVDSLPNTVLEGMALGKPAVVSDVAGVPTMVLDGKTGFVIPMHDSQALARALIRVLDDPALAERLGVAAKARYEAGYTPAHLARRMEALFDALHARRRRR